MKIDGVIFDADGTLLDSMYVWGNLAEEYLKSIGVEPKSTVNSDVENMSVAESALYLKNEYELKLDADEIIDGIALFAEEKYRCEIKLKQGAEEFLKALDEKEVKMCIATSGDRKSVWTALKNNHADKYFSDIVTCGEAGEGKTSSKVFELALQRLEASKENTVVVEDALFAAQTAKAAGFNVACIYDESELNQADLKELSDWYFKDFYEAKEVLL